MGGSGLSDTQRTRFAECESVDTQRTPYVQVPLSTSQPSEGDVKARHDKDEPTKRADRRSADGTAVGKQIRTGREIVRA